MSFVIHANLDVEATWAGVPLPGRVTRRIAQLAPLLAALAPTDDVEIWAPAPAPGVRVGTPTRADLRWADPAARAANDRRLARAVFAMDGAREIHALADLDDARGRWVCKARWTAAGRDRAHGDGPPTGELRVFVARLLDRFGSLIYEPWLERVADLGVCAWVGPPPATLPARLATGAAALDATVRAWPPHRLRSGERGAFLGIAPDAPALEPAHRAQLDDAVLRAGHAIAATGYAGPFAVDAFLHRGGLHLTEINARYTFGFIARALGGTLDVTAPGA